MAARAEIRTRDGRSRGSDSDHYRPPHLPCSNHSGLTHSVRSLFAVCKIIYSLLSMVCMGLRHNLCDGKNPSHHRQYICTLYTVYCIVYMLYFTPLVHWKKQSPLHTRILVCSAYRSRESCLHIATVKNSYFVD